MHTAWLSDPGGMASGAVRRQQAQERRDWHVGSVLLHQSVDAGLPAAVAEVAGNVHAGHVPRNFTQEA